MNVMSRRQPMDPAFPINEQIAIETGPVVLVNLFLLAPEDEEQFLEAWKVDAAWMKARPGFISTQLHRAVGPSPAYFNYAVWQSNAHFRDAFTHPEFREKLTAYPATATASPHLFETVAVDGICVA